MLDKGEGFGSSVYAGIFERQVRSACGQCVLVCAWA